jgi:hypothetical protein
MSKVLIVVFSWTGTAQRLGQQLAAAQQWTLAEIHDAKPGRTAWRCVVESLLRRRPTIEYHGPDPQAFDAVVLISPIWVGRLAAPMRSFVAQRAAALPRTAVVSVMGSRGAPAALAEISALLGHAPMLDASFTQREVEDGSCSARLQALGTAVSEALAHTGAVLRPAFGYGT